MKAKGPIAAGVSAVSFLLGAFGGFLKTSAPPRHPLHDTNSSFAVGVASLLTLVVFLAIAAVVQRSMRIQRRGPWFALSAVAVGVFILTAWLYNARLNVNQFPYPGESDVAYTSGSVLTAQAETVMRSNPSLSKTHLVAGFGGIANSAQVWTEESIDRVHLLLSVLYIALVVSIGAALFAIAQGVMARMADDG